MFNGSMFTSDGRPCASRVTAVEFGEILGTRFLPGVDGTVGQLHAEARLGRRRPRGPDTRAPATRRGRCAGRAGARRSACGRAPARPTPSTFGIRRPNWPSPTATTSTGTVFIGRAAAFSSSWMSRWVRSCSGVGAWFRSRRYTLDHVAAAGHAVDGPLAALGEIAQLGARHGAGGRRDQAGQDLRARGHQPRPAGISAAGPRGCPQGGSRIGGRAGRAPTPSSTSRRSEAPSPSSPSRRRGLPDAVADRRQQGQDGPCRRPCPGP